MPIYFFHGVYDYTCSYGETKRYFNKLNAPVKGFYYSKQSAHSPIFEEPERTQMIGRNDMLNQTVKLSDEQSLQISDAIITQTITWVTDPANRDKAMWQMKMKTIVFHLQTRVFSK